MAPKARPSTVSSSKRKFEEEEEEEEESSSDSDGYGSDGPEEYDNEDPSEDEHSDEDDDQDDDEGENVASKEDEDVPLYMRLSMRNTDEAVTAQAREKVKKRRLKEAAQGVRNGTERFGIGIDRKSKNAPAEMPSNRPVRRLRVDANNATKKTVDPRFTDVSGKLDEKIFNKNYSFLDEYRDKEIEVLNKVVKKIKNPDKKDEVKAELLRMKQQSKERKRGLRVMERLDSIRTEEREKVKQGKKPFFLKNSVKNTIHLEEKYKELRKEGKLHKFMEKRRRKNSAKDHRWLPYERRGSAEE